MMDNSEFLRAIIENPDSDAHRLAYADWLDERAGDADVARAEFIRVQCELAPWDLKNDPLINDRLIALRRRERELMTGPACRVGIDTTAIWPIEFHRGFVESITCTWADWLAHHDAIRAATPLRSVRLTTVPDWETQFGDQPGSDGVSWLEGEFDPHLFSNREVEQQTRPGESVVMGLLRLRWPGIDFTIPPIQRAPQPRSGASVGMALPFGPDHD